MGKQGKWAGLGVLVVGGWWGGCGWGVRLLISTESAYICTYIHVKHQSNYRESNVVSNVVGVTHVAIVVVWATITTKAATTTTTAV